MPKLYVMNDIVDTCENWVEKSTKSRCLQKILVFSKIPGNPEDTLDMGYPRIISSCIPAPSSGFPHHVKDFSPSHIFTVIPTAFGEASQPQHGRGSRPPEGAIVRVSKGSTAVVRVRVRYPLGGS